MSKHLQDACGQCGFNITENGNQKFQYKTSGLVMRNRFSCQRYTLYKGTTKEISGLREYRNYTLHNDQLNQRDQGRKKCRRSFSSKSITKENRCKFFFYMYCGKYGFYVELGLGNNKHTHHSPINGPSKWKNKRGIAQNEQDLINDILEGQAQDIQI